MTTFKLQTSCHNQACIQGKGISVALLRSVRGIVCNPFMPSDDYKAAVKVRPFVQGYDERFGWILVEFWAGTPEDHQGYVNYLNSKLPQE